MNSPVTNIRLMSYPTSPYAMKVGCYLKYKQLPFKLVGVNPINNHEIRFSGQRQVPVLVVGQEWKKESSDIGIWLDELYPEKPLLGKSDDDRQRILSVDKWISEQLIPSRFRETVQAKNKIHAAINGWKLAKAVHSVTPIPMVIRAIWPLAIRHAPFIKRMITAMDLNESIEDMRVRLINEFVSQLGSGPFLADQQQPSLADLSAYPIIVSGKLTGMKGSFPFLQNPIIKNWALAVKAQLPENPLLVKDEYIINPNF